MTKQIATNALPLCPPRHVPLEPVDQPHWASLSAELARSNLSNHQMDIAAMLARTMANLVAEQRSLFFEGSLVRRKDGCLGPNPRNRVVRRLTAQVLAFRRSLGLPHRIGMGANRAQQSYD